MERLRVSAISFLNTAPLMSGFDHGDLANNNDFQVSYTLPSQCAAQLQAGHADIGIIPVAAYASIPNLVILPGVAIAALRKVRSILLVCKVPRDQIRTVALDASSMTSVALTKVLFARWWNHKPDFVSMPPDLDHMLRDHDAALVIGDPALRIDRSRYLTFDLAEEWNRLTGKPFVFAFWAVRQAALMGSLGFDRSRTDLPGNDLIRNDGPRNDRSSGDLSTLDSPSSDASALDLATIFQRSRDHGLEPASLARIAREWSPKLGLAGREIHAYLTENIHYHLDAACLDGLRLFLRYAHECGALPSAPQLRFLESAKLAAL
jgi:chorismate dehydratase